MNPIDHVVTQIHRVGVRGKHLDLKCVLETRGLESLIPPACALDQRILYRLRCAVIYVIDDGFYGFAHCRVRVFLLKAMAYDPSLFEVLVYVRTVIVKADIYRTCTRIETAWSVFIIRELDERLTLANRNVFAHRGDLIDQELWCRA